MTSVTRPIVIGIGNEWRRDDGAGIAVARALGDQTAARIIEQSGDVNELLDALEQTDLAVIVDSTSSGSTPGLVRRLDPARDDLSAALPRTSSHAFGLADALELADALGRLPKRVVVYGIEGGRFDVGRGLSPAVEAAVSNVADRLRAELDSTSSTREEPCTSRP